METKRSRIQYLAFGGTIASLPKEGESGARPTLSAAEVLARVPQLADVAEIEGVDFPTIASYAVTLEHMLDLAVKTDRALSEGCDGVVISHGTDTIEETAYALALMVPRKGAVVLTGAMRNPSLPGADGPANLTAAFRVAASPEAAEVGPVLVLNDELHTARFGMKTHTSRPSTLQSPATGPIGEVIEGRVDVWFRPAWEDYLGRPSAFSAHDVQLVRVAAGGDETLLRAAVASRPDGVVVEGFGGGHVPLPLLPVIDQAVAAGIPVVIATRGIAGANLERTYRLEGAETDLIERGAIPAGTLSGQKARLRLLVGVALGLPADSLFPVR